MAHGDRLPPELDLRRGETHSWEVYPYHRDGLQHTAGHLEPQQGSGGRAAAWRHRGEAPERGGARANVEGVADGPSGAELVLQYWLHH